MTHFLSYTAEALNNYRTSVTDRLKESLKALESFSEENTGSPRPSWKKGLPAKQRFGFAFGTGKSIGRIRMS
jgi:hypothetical protein